MALVSSLFTAISGMRNHQRLLDVISNNVANVNTIGYKAGRVQFRDLLSQTLSGATGSNPASGFGGTNPIQMGVGAAVSSIDMNMTQGTLQATGVATDMAITGDGFFVLNSGGDRIYSRAGSFRFDNLGRLVDPNGFLVEGWSAAQPANDPLGRMSITIDPANPTKGLGAITITSGQVLPPHETQNVGFVGSLDAGANHTNLANTPLTTSGVTQLTVTNYPVGVADAPITYTYTVGQKVIDFTVYDSLGNQHVLHLTMTNLSDTVIPNSPPDTLDPATAAYTAPEDLPFDPILNPTGRAQPARYENNTWAWSVSVDSADTSVMLAPDNMTYVDPTTADLVRSAHSGLMKFNTNGSLDYVTYNDTNANGGGDVGGVTTADIAENPLGFDLTQWGLSEDENRNTIIGMEGATVDVNPSALAPLTDAGIDVTSAGGAFDLPGTEDQTDNQAISPTISQAFDLRKLPIVLVFQTLNTVPVVTPPVATTAGTLIRATTNSFVDPITGGLTNSFFNDGSDVQTNPLASTPNFTETAGLTPVAMYVQKFDIDWGGVSTITAADFDWINQNHMTTPMQSGLTDAPDIGEAVGAPFISRGDGDRDWAIGIGGSQPKTISLGNGDRSGFYSDSTGTFQTVAGVTFYVPDFSTAKILSQDGFSQGVLNRIAIDADGRIIGTFADQYNNTMNQDLAQIAIANFQNPQGMSKLGSSTFQPTLNSGDAQIGTANTKGRGMVVSGMLEQSNVDLSEELTNMITAQRGFEANARLVTTSDRILDTLINLGR